jgi:hypothetical protein
MIQFGLNPFPRRKESLSKKSGHHQPIDLKTEKGGILAANSVDSWSISMK